MESFSPPAAPIFLILPPEENALPTPVRITTRASGLLLASVTAAISASIIGRSEIALRVSGSFRLSVTIPSASISVRTRLMRVFPFLMSTKAKAARDDTAQDFTGATTQRKAGRSQQRISQRGQKRIMGSRLG